MRRLKKIRPGSFLKEVRKEIEEAILDFLEGWDSDETEEDIRLGLLRGMSFEEAVKEAKEAYVWY